MWVDQVESLSLNHQRIKNMVVLLMHDILWNLIWGKRLSPICRHINTSWVSSMLGHQHVFKKNNIPLTQSIHFLLNYPGGLPYQIPKSWLFQNPAQFFVSIFWTFSKKISKNPVFKRKAPNKLLPQISLPGHGARFRGFGGFRFLASGTGCLGVVENPHGKSGKVAVENRCLLEGYRFLVGNVKFGAMFGNHFFKMPRKNPWLSWHNPGLNCVEAWKNMRWFENWGVDAHVWTRRV